MKQPTTITHIVVHHSASKPETTVEEITQWHIQRGFSGIGYHKVITDDGIINIGRQENVVPASVQGHNKGTLAVCLTGNFETDKPTLMQEISLQLLIQEWKTKHPTAIVVGHRDLGATLCPGKNLYDFIKKTWPNG
jgi:N-acetylmuramoyl-L-alanine amidase